MGVTLEVKDSVSSAGLYMKKPHSLRQGQSDPEDMFTRLNPETKTSVGQYFGEYTDLRFLELRSKSMSRLCRTQRDEARLQLCTSDPSERLTQTQRPNPPWTEVMITSVLTLQTRSHDLV